MLEKEQNFGKISNIDLIHYYQYTRNIQAYLQSLYYFYYGFWNHYANYNLNPNIANHNTVDITDKNNPVIHNIFDINLYYDELDSIRKIKQKGKTYSKILTVKMGRMNIRCRLQKILIYKNKLHEHRKTVPVSREFTGRSNKAKIKMRIRGRFVKKLKPLFRIEKFNLI
jgi:hypothetical protein